MDDIDGTLHRAMSPRILFRAQWANDTQALAGGIEAIVRSQPTRPSESGGIVRPTLRMLRNIAPVLDRAGAWRDLSFPDVGWNGHSLHGAEMPWTSVI